MTDRSALWIGGMIVAAILLDYVANDGRIGFFLIRKLVDLIEYLAVWR